MRVVTEVKSRSFSLEIHTRLVSVGGGKYKEIGAYAAFAYYRKYPNRSDWQWWSK